MSVCLDRPFRNVKQTFVCLEWPFGNAFKNSVRRHRTFIKDNQMSVRRSLAGLRLNYWIQLAGMTDANTKTATGLDV